MRVQASATVPVSSCSSPSMAYISVVFPHPLGPITADSLPAANLIVMFARRKVAAVDSGCTVPLLQSSDWFVTTLATAHPLRHIQYLNAN